MRRDLPSGTVTFLFTDVEGSTTLLHDLGAQGYAEALAEHRRVLREAFQAHKGVEVDTQGDAFFVAFPTAPGALAAVEDMLRGLASGPIRVRMGLHTGTPFLAEEGYVGPDVNRAARIAACGHGGQVLVSSSTASLLGTDGLRDLGEHRLKDLSAPERVYQLGEEELAQVLALLSSGDSRLLTLTGPGGTGKTRLALQAAAEASDSFPDGVFWVPLAPLRDPALVLERGAQAVGSNNGLAEHISDKQLLLLFDNFEQVVEAGSELAELLVACPRLDVMVTSRERLRVGGEQTYSVPPLAESDAVALFSARARAVDPSFSTSDAVEELCRRLDELPLALELAAARTALFSPEQLLERLSQRLDLLKGERDADPRQQTLRATIEWSYDLLSAEEQRLFARLSVFAGGSSYDAAEAVAGADPDTLQSLLDKSLLRKRDSELGPRYWMLETIREYAGERLRESVEAENVLHRHAEFFLALAEEAHPHLPLHPREWVERLEQEHDNFRAALDWLEMVGESERNQQLAGALWPFWYIRGHVAEGRRRLESTIRTDERPTAARARALNGATAMALERGDPVTARPWAEEALALHRALGDVWGTANSILMFGNVHAEEHDLSTAQQLFEDARRRFSRLGDEHFMLLATRLVAWMCYDQGNRDRARTLHENVVRRARLSGNERMQATSLGALAEYALNDGRVTEALPMLTESTRIYRDLGERHALAINLCRFASATAAAGREGAAARILAGAEVVREEIGVSWSYWVVEMNDVTLAAVHSQLDEAAFAEAWGEGRALTVDEAIALAVSHVD